MSLNLKHLRYFWATARWGGVHRAAERLHLSPQTLSGQIKLLEAQLGVALFRSVGRRLELTEAGRLAYQQADRLFEIAEDLQATLQALPTGGSVPYRVGITDGVPRSLAHQLLAPALAHEPPVRLSCSHERLETLLADLALQRLDLVLADRPVPAGSSVRVFNHPLGTSAVGIFAEPALARSVRRGFPRSLHGQPMLVPGADNAVHGAVVEWLEQHGIAPRVVGEFDDSALMKAFGAAGVGSFPAPMAVRAEIERNYGVRLVALAEGLTERYYAISTERRAIHPITRRVLEHAGATLDPLR